MLAPASLFGPCVFRAALLCKGLWLEDDPLPAAHNPSPTLRKTVDHTLGIVPVTKTLERLRAALFRQQFRLPQHPTWLLHIVPPRTRIVSAQQPLCIRNTTKKSSRTTIAAIIPQEKLGDSCQNRHCNGSGTKVKVTIETRAHFAHNKRTCIRCSASHALRLHLFEINLHETIAASQTRGA